MRRKGEKGRMRGEGGGERRVRGEGGGEEGERAG